MASPPSAKARPKNGSISNKAFGRTFLNTLFAASPMPAFPKPPIAPPPSPIKPVPKPLAPPRAAVKSLIEAARLFIPVPISAAPA